MSPPTDHLDTSSFVHLQHAKALAQNDRPVTQPPAVNAATPTTAAPRQRLTREQVKYLVFEGGGGKGFAYLGALRALENLRVIRHRKADDVRHSRLDPRHIRGIGGASAGAVTAFLVSIGYTANELAAFMAVPKQFDAFFDGGFNGKLADGTRVRRLRPIYRGALSVDDTEVEEELRKKLSLAEAFASIEGTVAEFEARLGLLPGSVGDAIKAFRGLVRDQSEKPPVSLIAPHVSDFLIALTSDWGLFAGCAARALFDKLLSERMPPRDGKPPEHTTFKEHYEEFEVELIVTGTNLETGKSQVFSCKDTPDFAVADAVRISMGIPFAFKPVVISGDSRPPKSDVAGVWVDGGLLNNLPFREFEDRPGDNPKTLALRLDFETTSPIVGFQDFLTRYLVLTLLGPGEAFITGNHTFQTIQLDAEGLSLLDFAPDAKVSDAAQKAAKLTTLAYFEPRNRDKPSLRVSVDALRRSTLSRTPK